MRPDVTETGQYFEISDELFLMLLEKKAFEYKGRFVKPGRHMRLLRDTNGTKLVTIQRLDPAGFYKNTVLTYFKII